MLHGRPLELPVKLLVRTWPYVWTRLDLPDGLGADLSVVRQPGKKQRTLDAWELRADFIHARKDRDMLRFLNSAGNFLVSNDAQKLNTYWVWQQLLGDMMKTL